MKKLIKRMRELTNMLEKMYEYANEHDEEATLEEAMELGEAQERASDLLYGFLTGNFEDGEIDEALEMCEFWGI